MNIILAVIINAVCFVLIFYGSKRSRLGLRKDSLALTFQGTVIASAAACTMIGYAIYVSSRTDIAPVRLIFFLSILVAVFFSWAGKVSASREHIGTPTPKELRDPYA